MKTNASVSEDRRKNPRIAFHLSVAVTGRKGLKEIRNFGIYGVFIKTDNPSQFKLMEKILLVMKLPHEKRGMGVKAKVVHVSKKGIGVEFIDVSPQDSMSLECCFNVFRGTMPLPGT